MNAVAKQTQAFVIHESMSGNPHFPNPAPSMAEFGQALEELKEANINALDRGRMAITKRNIAEDRISRMITALAGYVNSICMGDPQMILSAGFKLQKQPEPISELHAPRSGTVCRTALPRQLKLTWRNVPGSRFYMVEEAIVDAEGNTEWHQLALPTRPQLLLKDRRVDLPYRFRIQARGTQVESPYAEVRYAKIA